MELLYVLWLLSNSNPIYGALVASVWSSDTINSQNLDLSGADRSRQACSGSYFVYSWAKHLQHAAETQVYITSGWTCSRCYFDIPSDVICEKFPFFPSILVKIWRDTLGWFWILGLCDFMNVTKDMGWLSAMRDVFKMHTTGHHSGIIIHHTVWYCSLTGNCVTPAVNSTFPTPKSA